jgi:predicted SAM-dependent methyltransferase
MNKNKWHKRLFKFKGFLNYVYSLLLLRYTPLNDLYLKKFFSSYSIEKLHVGCGVHLLKGWCNVLFEPNQEYGRLKNVNGIDFLNFNLLRPWPWPENSISFIAGSHFIEHLDLNQCLQFNKAAFRVLKAGGIIRLSCPDLETYALNYIKKNSDFFNHEEIKKACAFKAAETYSQIFAAKAYDCGGAHKWFHDFSSLENILKRAGFVRVRKVKRLEGETPDLEKLEPVQREIETLYVEATKP